MLAKIEKRAMEPSYYKNLFFFSLKKNIPNPQQWKNINWKTERSVVFLRKPWHSAPYQYLHSHGSIYWGFSRKPGVLRLQCPLWISLENISELSANQWEKRPMPSSAWVGWKSFENVVPAIEAAKAAAQIKIFSKLPPSSQSKATTNWKC